MLAMNILHLLLLHNSTFPRIQSIIVFQEKVWISLQFPFEPSPPLVERICRYRNGLIPYRTVRIKGSHKVEQILANASCQDAGGVRQLLFPHDRIVGRHILYTLQGLDRNPNVDLTRLIGRQ